MPNYQLLSTILCHDVIYTSSYTDKRIEDKQRCDWLTAIMIIHKFFVLSTQIAALTIKQQKHMICALQGYYAALW